jgi:hypothetical protein
MILILAVPYVVRVYQTGSGRGLAARLGRFLPCLYPYPIEKLSRAPSAFHKLPTASLRGKTEVIHKLFTAVDSNTLSQCRVSTY